MTIIILSLGALVSYLIGSIPTAYIFGKTLKGIDIREFGSERFKRVLYLPGLLGTE